MLIMLVMLPCLIRRIVVAKRLHGHIHKSQQSKRDRVRGLTLNGSHDQN